jgi:hypothetical protein
MSFIMIGSAVAPLFYSGYVLGFISDSAWTGVGIGSIVLFLTLHAFGSMAITQFRFEMLVILPLALLTGSAIGAINLFALNLPPLYRHLAIITQYWNESVDNVRSVVYVASFGPFLTSIAALIIFGGALLISDPYDISQARAVTTGVLFLFIGIVLFVVAVVFSTALDRKYGVYILLLLITPVLFAVLYKGGFGIILVAILTHTVLSCLLVVLDLAFANAASGKTITVSSDPRTSPKLLPNAVFTARWLIGVWLPLFIAWVAFLIVHFFISESSGGIILVTITFSTAVTIPVCFWYGKNYGINEKVLTADKQSSVELGTNKRDDEPLSTSASGASTTHRSLGASTVSVVSTSTVTSRGSGTAFNY